MVKRELPLAGAMLLLLVLILARFGFFDPQRLARGLQNMLVFSREMVPPDIELVPLAARALAETIQMAVAGTFLGFFLALPLGVLGARLRNQSIDNTGGVCDKMEVETDRGETVYYFEISRIFKGYKNLGLY